MAKEPQPTYKTIHDANFRGRTITEKTSFQNIHFTGTADFRDVSIQAPVDFTDTTFLGDADFSGMQGTDSVRFARTSFKGLANFSTVRFGHDAHFIRVVFERPVDFSGSTFHARTIFDHSRFLEAATFSGARFRGAAGFAGSEFARAADFTATQFISFADFSQVKFEGRAVFAGASIECKTIFREAVFTDDAVFGRCRFTHPLNFQSAVFHKAADFEGVVFLQFVDFLNARFESTASFSPPQGAEGLAPEIRFESVTLLQPTQVRFAGVSFERITLMGTVVRDIVFKSPRWPRKGLFGKRAVIYDEIQKEKPNPEKLARLYRDIRSNLRRAGIRQDVGDLFYSEMEVRRKQRRDGNDSLYFFRRYLSPYTLLWLTSGYGRRPWRILVTAAVIGLISLW